MIDTKELARFRELSKKATPRPWGNGKAFDLAIMQIDPDSDGYGVAFCYPILTDDKVMIDSSVYKNPRTYRKWRNDLNFIVAACNAFIPLLDEIERLQKAQQWILTAEEAPEEAVLVQIDEQDVGYWILTNDGDHENPAADFCAWWSSDIGSDRFIPLDEPPKMWKPLFPLPKESKNAG